MKNKDLAKPNNLPKYRKEEGYTQQEAGELYGRYPNDVCRYESGDVMPDLIALRRMQKVYGVSDLAEFYPKLKEIDVQVEKKLKQKKEDSFKYWD